MQQEIDYGKLGQKIKEVRLLNGLTQDKLAEAVSCNTSHISNIENNHTKVSLNILLAIANTLNTTIDALLFEQYENKALSLENEISKAVAKCDIETKQLILRIIKVL